MVKKLLAFLVLVSALRAAGLSYVIFKLDDIEAHAPFVTYMWTNVANTLLQGRIHASFGLIGVNTETLGETYPAFWSWVANNRSNGIELWNHSYGHTDCSILDEPDQVFQLTRNQNLYRRKTGLPLPGYGAGFNAFNGRSIDVVNRIDAMDYWFFGNSNTVKKNFLRLGDMEYPTLAPQFAAFMSNWPTTLSKITNAGVDYLVLQGHPSSWDTNRFTNFLNVLGFLTNQGLTFVTPSEYIALKTGGLAISNLARETVFSPGASISGNVTGTSPTWSIDLVDGYDLQNLASGSGSTFSAVLPSNCKISNRVRITVSGSGFNRCQTHAIAPLGTNDLATGATLGADSQSSGGEAGLAVDRSLATAWRPSGALPQALRLDFGTNRLVESAYLAWRPDRQADIWSVHGSGDGIAWGLLASNAIGEGGGEFVRFSPTNVRFLRLTAHRAINTNAPVELAELFAFDAKSPFTNTSTTLILAEADTQVNSSLVNSNYGASPFMELQGATGKQDFLRFPVGVTNPSTLLRATLRLYPTAGNSASTTNLVKLVADNSWGETTLTWSNRPAIGATLGQGNPYGYRLEVDVTGAVSNAMAADGKVSFAVVATDNQYLRFTSREETNYAGARGPTLELVYAGSVIQPPAGSNAVVATNATNASTVPEVLWTAPRRSVAEARLSLNPVRLSTGAVEWNDLPENATVRIYSARGNLLAVVRATEETRASGRLAWSLPQSGPSALPRGMYLVRIDDGREYKLQKLMLVD